MKIRLESVYVSDLDKALAFYTDVLGFIKKRDIPLGDSRYVTVVSPDEPDATELLLEFGATVATEDQVRMAVDKRRGYPTPGQGAGLDRGVFRQRRAFANPRDQAVADPYGAVLDRAVVGGSALHGRNVRIREQQVPVGHYFLRDFAKDGIMV